MLFQRMLLGICFCLFSFSVPSSIFAAPAPSGEAARVIAVTPGVFVLRGDTRTPLQLKDPLFIEDKIVTDASGKLQILFTDDTTVAVAPDSQVNIADFSFTPAKASFALGVGRGLARVVTGKVVEQNREGFKVSTPHATAGIRGTILTADVRNPSQSKFILSQLGAGHTVSVLNSATGQRTEMPKAGLTTEVGAQGNSVRPATPAEMTTAQTVTRQTRQTTPVAAANTTSRAAQSPASTQSQAGVSGSAKGTGTAGTAALADANTTAGNPTSMPTGSVEDPSGGHGVAGKAENVVNQVVATGPSNVIKDMGDSGFTPAAPSTPGGGGSTPEVPSTPGGGGSTPEVPDTPGGGGSTPEVPDTPGGGGSTPEVPDTPGGGGSTPDVPDIPDGGLTPDVPDIPGDPDIPGGGPDTPGGTDNPGALEASYAGTLGGSFTGSGTFSFDANLGSGDLTNGKMDVTANSGHTYNGLNGSGQITGNEFGLGFIDVTEKNPGGQLTGNIGTGSIDGTLTPDKGHVNIDGWGVTTGPNSVDGNSGSGSRQ